MDSKNTELTTDDLALILQEGDFLVEDSEDRQSNGNVRDESECGCVLKYYFIDGRWHRSRGQSNDIIPQRRILHTNGARGVSIGGCK